MKKIVYFLSFIWMFSCASDKMNKSDYNLMDQSQLENEKVRDYSFLICMYEDSYFPEFLTDKCKYILLDLCGKIEEMKPSSIEELYSLSHISTNKINELQNEFFENNSEIETVARDCIAMDFAFIAQAYSFDADVEELIAPREW